MKEILQSQYRASTKMLGDAIEACPDSLWNDRAYKNPFWHIAFDPEGLDPHAWFVGHYTYGIEENVVEVPSRLALDVRPNPVSRHTSISYALTTAGDVSLRIFDLLGRNVSTVETSYKNAGVYTLNLDTSELANGTYFLVLDTAAGTMTRSLVVVR